MAAEDWIPDDFGVNDQEDDFNFQEPRAGQGWWKPKTGSKIRISKMEMSYLVNAILLLISWNKHREYDEKLFELCDEYSKRVKRLKK